MMFSELETAGILAVKTKLYNDFGSLLGMMPKHLQSLIIEKGILTGGCISSTFHMTSPKDYDVYLADTEAIKQFETMTTIDGTVTRMIADVNPNYRVHVPNTNGKLITENAVTFQNGIQVITRATAEEARSTFDFIHCMPYLKLKEKQFYISREQYDSIKHKRIVPNKKGFMGNILVSRVEKYKERGWTGP